VHTRARTAIMLREWKPAETVASRFATSMFSSLFSGIQCRGLRINCQRLGLKTTPGVRASHGGSIIAPFTLRKTFCIDKNIYQRYILSIWNINIFILKTLPYTYVLFRAINITFLLPIHKHRVAPVYS
jgi:hypothetical protein